QQHEKQYGGYIVHITKKNEEEPSELGEARLTIAVKTAEWNIGFGGGFNASGLVDPAYGVEEVEVPAAGTTPARTESRLRREEEREDAANLALSSLAHVWHSNRPWVALSFGLGVDRGRGAEYYFGPSLRFGDKATLTTGVALGRVRTLPSGVELGDAIDDPNILNNLGNRTRVGWFVGMSYSFAGTGQSALAQPFLGEQPQVPSGGGGGGDTNGQNNQNQNNQPGPNVAPPANPRQLEIRAEAQVPEVEAGQEVELVVTVKENNQAASGIRLQWTVTPQANGTVTPSETTTGSDGEARVKLKVRSTPGPGNIEVKVAPVAAVGAADSSKETFIIRIRG
ncbi:MAG TPA: Ig-like domain-containing protein, partial [Longimicrobiaceae bacterium]|nr:Ig-like domain-containing protein [Longimicrobiaceae bacterium]